jgi:mono/diheme cytochrome c family protein
MMIRSIIRLVFAAALLVVAGGQANADDKQVARGKYLVTLGSCTDCHTPGNFFGKPDMARYLGGSDVGFDVPGLGVFVGPNLTPDKATGLGSWSAKQIVTALKTGVLPDGRQLVPIMPWMAYANLTNGDAYAIAAYLKSLKPVKNQVPGPFGSSEKPTVFVMTIIPGSGMPPPPAPAPAPGQQK